MFKVIAKAATTPNPKTYDSFVDFEDALYCAREVYKTYKLFRAQGLVKVVVQTQILDDSDQTVYRIGSI
jgi:hypothetical protein